LRPDPAVPVVRVARRPLVQTLVVSGRVMPPARVNLGSMVTGVVSQRLAEDGQRVRAGEVLLRLDDAEARAAVAQARGAVNEAVVRLEQVRTVTLPMVAEAHIQARLTYERAERERQRTQALADAGVVTPSQLDDATKSVDVARSLMQAAAVQQAGSAPSGVDERVARTVLDQARAALAAAETRLGQLVIHAPGDGLVIARKVEAGDIVQPGQALLVVALDGPTLLRIDPDEKNLAGVWVGQAAAASADAFPGDSFPAVVSFIGAAVDPQRGTVEVRLTVPLPPPTLRPDMTVSVELQGSRRESALVVPVDCVRDEAGRGAWALVLDRGTVVRRPVRTGLRGDTLLEVAAGLHEGEWVIPASAGAPEPGARRTPRPVGR
jgi:HlyD family secretion protein